METCELPILAGFEEILRSCQPAYPASPLLLPGSAEAQKMTVGSGRQCSMLLNESDPLGAFSKILLESSAWGNSMECCYVWERLDTRFELSAFRLRRWEPATNDSECSLSPTAHANCSTGAGTQGRDGGMNLQTPVKLSPTPTIPNGGRVNPEGTSITGRKPDGSKAQMDLANSIKLALSPTPRIEGFDAGSHRGNPDSLHAMVKLSATPSARDFKNGKSSKRTAERNSRPLNEQVINNIVCEDSGTGNPLSVTGSLSAEFVEEYMGFPVGHTALKHSGTQSSRPKRTRSSRQSRK